MKVFIKTISMLAMAAMTIAACQEKEGEEYNPDITFSRTGEVTLEASIENATVTKASMVGTGEARWLAEDKIAVICDDNSSVVFNIDGSGQTRKAFFKGEIPAGKTMGNHAWYPATAEIENGKVQYELPATVANGAGGECGLMVAEIKDSEKIEFKQAVSYLNVSVNDIDVAQTKALKLIADKPIAGTFPVDLAQVIENGIVSTDQSKEIEISLAGVTDKLSFTIAVPSGEYRTLSVVGYDKKGEEVTRGELLAAPATLARAEYTSLSVALPEVEVNVDDVPEELTIALPMTADALPEGFPTTLETSGTGDETSYTFTIGENDYVFSFDPDAAGQNQVADKSASKPGYYFTESVIGGDEGSTPYAGKETCYYVMGATYGYVKFPAIPGMRLQSVSASIVTDRNSGKNPVKGVVIRQNPETNKVASDAFFSDIDASAPISLSGEQNTDNPNANWKGTDHTWTFPEGENGTKANTSYCIQSRNGQLWLAKLELKYVRVTE